jgi:hypothetical protein
MKKKIIIIYSNKEISKYQVKKKNNVKNSILEYDQYKKNFMCVCMNLYRWSLTSVQHNSLT